MSVMTSAVRLRNTLNINVRDSERGLWAGLTDINVQEGTLMLPDITTVPDINGVTDVTVRCDTVRCRPVLRAVLRCASN